MTTPPYIPSTGISCLCTRQNYPLYIVYCKTLIHTKWLGTINLGPTGPTRSHTTTASPHPSYPQLPQVTPTSSRPLLPSLPAQLTTTQFPSAFPQFPSPSFFNITPQDMSLIPAPATVTTPPDFPPPVTSGMRVSQYTWVQHIVFCLKSNFHNYLFIGTYSITI